MMEPRENGRKARSTRGLARFSVLSFSVAWRGKPKLMQITIRRISKYPPGKAVGITMLAPQRGRTGKRPLTQRRRAATLSPREREKLSVRHWAPETTPDLSEGRGCPSADGRVRGLAPSSASRQEQVAAVSVLLTAGSSQQKSKVPVQIAMRTRSARAG
jgi:hypothetical protein